LSGGQPFLMEKKIGTGKILLMASGLEKSSSNIIENGFAVPLILNSLAYLSGSGRGGEFYYTVGDVINLEKKFSIVEQSKQYIKGNSELLSGFKLEKPGFYNLYDAEGNYMKKIGVNNEREKNGDISELLKSIFTAFVYDEDIDEGARIISYEKNHLSRYLLIFILMLSAADILIVRKM
jgi:hypothetical protein